MFAGAVFAGLFVFLFVAHPLILSDTDDWYYTSYWRRPLPIFGSFNSMKVFPETFMPLCSMVAVNIVMPFLKDYLMSLAFVYAIVGAAFITLYVYLVARLVESVSGCSAVSADMIATCFLMFHFLMYKNGWTENLHLFWSTDVTCFFHYTLTAVFNACIVLFFLREETVRNRSISVEIAENRFGYLKSGLLVLVLYLGIFSNSFTNVILAVYCGTHLFRSLLKEEKGTLGSRFKNLWKYYSIHVVIIAAWVIAVIFQLFDARNENARSQGMTGSMSGALRNYINNFTSANKMAALICVIIAALFIAAVIMKGKSKKADDKDKVFTKVLTETLLSFVLISVYLILLCGVANPKYLVRNDVKLGIFFYGLVTIAVMLGYLVKSTALTGERAGRLQRVVMMLLPLITFVMVSQTLNYCKSYREYNLSHVSHEKELEISGDLIEQFKAAETAGLDEFELHVFVNESSGDNWPYPDYAGDVIGDALFRHGVISRQIKATTVFDPSKNAAFKLN